MYASSEGPFLFCILVNSSWIGSFGSSLMQSYEIKSPLSTILWFRILGIFSVENIKRLCVFMLQTWDNSQLLRRVLWISAELPIVSSLQHKNAQPLYILNRVTVLHLNKVKERTWLHSFGKCQHFCFLKLRKIHETNWLEIDSRHIGFDWFFGVKILDLFFCPNQ